MSAESIWWYGTNAIIYIYITYLLLRLFSNKNNSIIRKKKYWFIFFSVCRLKYRTNSYMKADNCCPTLNAVKRTKLFIFQKNSILVIFLKEHSSVYRFVCETSSSGKLHFFQNHQTTHVETKNPAKNLCFNNK